MRPVVKNEEALILEVRKSGEGGRSVRLFSRWNGQMRAFISKSTLTKWGTGPLFPFSFLRYSFVQRSDMAILTQYEGIRTVDFLNMPYDEVRQWYYVSEIADRFFPEGAADGKTYTLLQQGALYGMEHNRTVVAMILAVQLLAAAGMDPANSEPEETLCLPLEARPLLRAFRWFQWRGDLGCRITRSAFGAIARYIDAFICMYGEVEIKTAGAFLSDKTAGVSS